MARPARTRSPRRGAGGAGLVLVGVVLAVSVALAPGSSSADIAPQSSTTTALANVTPSSAVTSTTLNASAGETNSGTTGTIVFVVVTAIIVIGGVLIFLRARANRLSSSG